MGIWIDVNDELPEIIKTGEGLQSRYWSKYVLTATASNAMGVCKYDHDGWKLGCRKVAGEGQMVYDYLVDPSVITHWQPLPEKPNKITE